MEVEQRVHGRAKPASPRSGFTVIEVLVVIVIVFVLLGLIVPAVQSVRESARRAQCINNLKQIGLGLQNYVSAIGVLPSAYATGIYDVASESGPNWAWGAMSLNFIDHATHFNSINFNMTMSRPTNATSIRIQIAAFACPSDTHEPFTINSWGYRNVMISGISQSNYIASAGNRALGRSFVSPFGGMFTRNSANTGVMYRNSAINLAAILDGTSHTFLVGERASNLAPATWSATLPIGTASICTSERNVTQECVSTNVLVLGHTGPENSNGQPMWVDAPNYAASGADGFRSHHAGACNFLFSDGSVRQVKNSIDPKVYAALSTRSGGESVVRD